MVSGRKIIETAVRMSLADLSVLLNASCQAGDDEVLLVTAPGSDNDRLWQLMAEKGWLTNRGNPRPELPIPLVSFSIVPEYRQHARSVALVCFEGLRQGMTPEEIIAFGEGQPDQRLAHLL